MKKKILFICSIFILFLGLAADIQARRRPVFIIITYGFWGYMDRLPSRDPAWLADSPYPHFRKHQSADFLQSPAYQPIPQKYLTTGEGPSLSKMFLCSYYLLEHEMAYWAKRMNTQKGSNRVEIIDDWQEFEAKVENGHLEAVGEVNIIYLKYDWRLDVPRVDSNYVAPLLNFIERFWPGAKIHWVGHSLGGLVGRYAVSAHPGRFDSLISIGGPQYGMYEIGLQCRGERTDFGGNRDLEKMQEISLRVAEKFFFGTDDLCKETPFPAAAREYIERRLPMMRWMDPQSGLLADGFGHLPLLKDATPHAIAIYGLGYGSYDLNGVYHPEIKTIRGIGPTLEPNTETSPDYAVCGDGRIDPVSARGPFIDTLCLGKEQIHGNLMWSPLVLSVLIDRYLWNGKMSVKDIWMELRRLQVPWESKKLYLQWIDHARELWEKGN